MKPSVPGTCLWVRGTWRNVSENLRRWLDHLSLLSFSLCSWRASCSLLWPPWPVDLPFRLPVGRIVEKLSDARGYFAHNVRRQTSFAAISSDFILTRFSSSAGSASILLLVSSECPMKMYTKSNKKQAATIHTPTLLTLTVPPRFIVLIWLRCLASLCENMEDSVPSCHSWNLDLDLGRRKGHVCRYSFFTIWQSSDF